MGNNTQGLRRLATLAALGLLCACQQQDPGASGGSAAGPMQKESPEAPPLEAGQKTPPPPRADATAAPPTAASPVPTTQPGSPPPAQAAPDDPALTVPLGPPCDSPEDEAYRRKLDRKALPEARIDLVVQGSRVGPGQRYTLTGQGQVTGGAGNRTVLTGQFLGGPDSAARPDAKEEERRQHLQRKVECLVVKFERAGFFSRQEAAPPEREVSGEGARVLKIAFAGRSASGFDFGLWTQVQWVLVEAGLITCEQTLACSSAGACHFDNGRCVTAPK